MVPEEWCQNRSLRVPGLKDRSPQKNKPLFQCIVNYNPAFQPTQPPRIQLSPHTGAGFAYVKAHSCGIFLALLNCNEKGLVRER